MAGTGVRTGHCQEVAIPLYAVFSLPGLGVNVPSVGCRSESSVSQQFAWMPCPPATRKDHPHSTSPR